MREIKFKAKSPPRAKNKDGIWVSGLLHFNAAECELQITEFIQSPPSQQDPGGNQYNIFHNIDPETVGQFTGLQDKNGKDVYEDADIINPFRNGGKPHKVIYSLKMGAFVGAYGSLEYLIAQELHEIEVIEKK